MRSSLWTFCALVLSFCFTFGAARELTVSWRNGQDLSAEGTLLIAAAVCLSVLMPRLRGAPAHARRILASYTQTAALTAAAVLAFATPTLLLHRPSAADLIVPAGVAAAIALIATLSLSRFYRRATPESPEDL